MPDVNPDRLAAVLAALEAWPAFQQEVARQEAERHRAAEEEASRAAAVAQSREAQAALDAGPSIPWPPDRLLTLRGVVVPTQYGRALMSYRSDAERLEAWRTIYATLAEEARQRLDGWEHSLRVRHDNATKHTASLQPLPAEDEAFGRYKVETEALEAQRAHIDQLITQLPETERLPEQRRRLAREAFLAREREQLAGAAARRREFEAIAG